MNDKDSVVKLRYFDFHLEEEDEDSFPLQIFSKDEKLYFCITLSKQGIYDIINGIENYLKDPDNLIPTKYLDQFEIFEEDGILLDFSIEKSYVSIHFYHKEEIIKFSSELKKSSGWNETILENAKTESSKKEDEENDDDWRHRKIQKIRQIEEEHQKRRDNLKPFIAIFESIQEEKIISEVIESIKLQYSVEKLCLIMRRDIDTCLDDYLSKLGLQNNDYRFLPDYLYDKYWSIRTSIKKKMQEVIQQSQLKFSENLIDEIHELTKKSNKKKITRSDLDMYLFEKNIKISPTMKSVIYAKVNKKLINS